MSRHKIQPPKNTPADRTRQAFYQLTLDWIHLHQQLPKPHQTTRTRRTQTREYGHPAEWAADKAAHISGILTDWHDLLAEHRSETRPANTITFGTNLTRAQFQTVTQARTSETRRVINAWRYLEPRFDQLCELVEPEAFTEIHDLHHGIRRALGYYQPKYTLSIPCPNSECGLLTLMRTVGVGQDLISCESCGYTIRETYYPLLIRMTLDTILREEKPA